MDRVVIVLLPLNLFLWMSYMFNLSTMNVNEEIDVDVSLVFGKFVWKPLEPQVGSGLSSSFVMLLSNRA